MFYPVVMFSAYTGARRGEVIALRWEDVDIEQGVVTIARSVTPSLRFKAPKNDRTRDLSMSAELVEVLREHQEAQRADREFLGPAYKDADLVFARADGIVVKPEAYGKAVLELLRRSGLQGFTLYSLRDTYASLLAAGVPIEVLSKRLGHSTILVTMERYLDVYASRDKAAAEAFSQFVSGLGHVSATN